MDCPLFTTVASALHKTTAGNGAAAVSHLTFEILLFHTSWVHPDAAGLVVMAHALLFPAMQRLLRQIVNDAQFASLPQGADSLLFKSDMIFATGGPQQETMVEYFFLLA